MRDPGLEYLSWMDLWAEAVAARELCVKNRMLGAGVELGKLEGSTPFSSLRIKHLASLLGFDDFFLLS